MSNLVQRSAIQGSAVQDVEKEKKYVLVVEESLDDEDEKNLEKLFYIYHLDPVYDYKVNVDQLLKETDFLIIDLSEKDALTYYSEVKDYLKNVSCYDVKIYYKSKHGKKIDVAVIKEKFNAEKVFKDLPSFFINSADYINRIADHISSGKWNFLCLKKN